MTEKLMAQEIDVITGEIIERPLNKDEIAEIEEMRQKDAEFIAYVEEKAAQKLSLLDKLGITHDEAKILLS